MRTALGQSSFGCGKFLSFLCWLLPKDLAQVFQVELVALFQVTALAFIVIWPSRGLLMPLFLWDYNKGPKKGRKTHGTKCRKRSYMLVNDTKIHTETLSAIEHWRRAAESMSERCQCFPLFLGPILENQSVGCWKRTVLICALFCHPPFALENHWRKRQCLEPWWLFKARHELGVDGRR